MTFILKVVTLSLCLLNKILIVKKTHIKQSTQTVDTLVYSDCGHTSLLRLWTHHITSLLRMTNNTWASDFVIKVDISIVTSSFEMSESAFFLTK